MSIVPNRKDTCFEFERPGLNKLGGAALLLLFVFGWGVIFLLCKH